MDTNKANNKDMQNTNLTVRVLDYNLNPINNAIVTLTLKTTPKQLRLTDKKGGYKVENISTGKYSILVEAEGFTQQERNVQLKPDGNKVPFFLGRKNMPFYYRRRVKVPFEPMNDLVAVTISESVGTGGSEAQKNVAQNIAKDLGLELQETGQNIARNSIYIFRLQKPASKKDWRDLIESLQQQKHVETAGPLLKLFKENATILTNELIIRTSKDGNDAVIERLARAYNFEPEKKYAPLGNVYKVTINDIPSYDVLETCNRIAEEESVVYAEPNLIHTVEDDNVVTPTDFLFPEQWDLELIRTRQAWKILEDKNEDHTFGDPDLIIAVIDSGIDAQHPEFDGTLSNGEPKIYQLYDFQNMEANNDNPPNNHGTCCASAATALANNSSDVDGVNEGVCGVAGNCQLMGIRRPGGPENRYAEMYLWTAGFDPFSKDFLNTVSDEDDFPDQINPGADIINSSFGFSAGSAISGLMQDTFDHLTDEGRDGKGVLLFFSAGNADCDLDVTFHRPWGMYERCFSVAASSLDTDGTSEIKADYSCYGSVIEFCAPSHDENVGGLPLHNSTENYATFTATRLNDTDDTYHPTVGRPTHQTELSAAFNAGDNILTVTDSDGFADGQAILIGDPGSDGTEGHQIENVTQNFNQVQINRPLFNNHPAGENVYAANRDYTSNFGGTSHSTPLAAGVAALILTHAKGLSWIQVRNLMRQTAEKIDPDNTDPEGRWHDSSGRVSTHPDYTGPHFSEFYGYGRLNVEAALSSLSGCGALLKTFLDLILNRNS